MDCTRIVRLRSQDGWSAGRLVGVFLVEELARLLEAILKEILRSFQVSIGVRPELFCQLDTTFRSGHVENLHDSFMFSFLGLSRHSPRDCDFHYAACRSQAPLSTATHVPASLVAHILDARTTPDPYPTPYLNPNRLSQN